MLSTPIINPPQSAILGIHATRDRPVVENGEIECWAHGSAFSLTTGKPGNLPAFEPVPVYVVEIEGDDVYIDPTVTKEIAA